MKAADVTAILSEYEGLALTVAESLTAGTPVLSTRTGGVVTVVPLTSNTTRVYPFQVPLPSSTTGLPRDAKAQAEQVRTVAVARIRSAVGWATSELMRELDAALRLHLAL